MVCGFWRYKVLCRYSSVFAGEVVSNESAVAENATSLSIEISYVWSSPLALHIKIQNLHGFVWLPSDSTALDRCMNRWTDRQTCVSALALTALLHRPTTRTHFANHAFQCCAPSVWNSLDSETLHCSSLSGFKRRLKSLLFRQTFSSTTWTVRQRL